MFNYFKLLNLFRENRVAWAGARVRKGAVQQPSQEQRTGEEKPSEGGKPEGKAAEVKAETKKGLAETKKEVEKETVEENTKQKIGDLHTYFEEQKKGLKRRMISRERDNNKIDANSLVPSTSEGIDTIEKIFKDKLLLDPDAVKWMTGEMREALKSTESQKSSEKRQLFIDAENKLGQCRGVFGERFYYAYLYFLEVKNLIKEYQSQDNTDVKNLRKKDSDPILTTVADKGTEIVNDAMKAVQEGDYAKMALYGIAGYSFYRIWKEWISPKLSSKKEGDFPWGGLLLAGTGIYCGLSIFAPDTLKKMWGKGIHADAKGGSAEDLANLLKQNPAAAEKGVEIGVLAAVTQANVKDVFAPILSFEGNLRYDAESSSAKMIQLTNSGLVGCFSSNPELLAAGPVYPDRPPYEKRTPMQKAYAKACEKLYRSAMWLKQEWDMRVLAGGRTNDEKKFEDAFLKETSGDWKMRDLYRELGAFASSVLVVTPFTDDLKDEAEKILNGSAGAKGMFTETDNVKIIQLESGFMKIRVRGFPFTVKLKEDSEKNRYYLFYPADDDMESSTPLASVDINKPGSFEEGALAVTTRVKNRMDELLDKYDIEGTSGKEAIKYEAGKWVASVTMPAVKKYGMDIPARKTEARVEVGADGESITFFDVNSDKPIYYVGKSMKKNHDYAPTVLNEMIFVQGGFDALKPMFQANKIRLEEIPGNESEFNLLFGDGELSLRIKAENGKFVSADKAKERDLIQSEVFRTQYVDAFAEQYFGFFDEMKKKVDKMPQSYFLYFPESMTKWFSGLKVDKWLNADSDVISGSIPNYFTYMLIDSKRDALKYRLFWKMADATSFKGVETAKTGIFDQLTEMERFANGNFLETMKGKNRDSWSRDEFMIKIVEPFRGAGVSRIYLSSIDYFENLMFKEISYKGERGGDVSEKSHALAGQLLSAFYYFTAEHDTDFKEGSPEEIKFENYCHYVADELFNQYEEPTKLTPNIPPENFKIARMDEWERTAPNPEKLKGVDAEGKLTVEEIKTKLSGDYSEVVSTLQRSYGVKVNLKYLQETLAEFAKKDDRFELHSKAIFDQSHGRRSNQISLIEEYKMDFVNELYEDKSVWNDLSAKEIFDVYVRKFWK